MRRRRTRWRAVRLTCAAVLACPVCLGAARRVALTVAERAGADRRDEPITTGVPIPKGELRSAAAVRLLRNGEEIPAQFRAAGLWRPGDSIRWLLVDCRTSIRANREQSFILEYGDGVKATASPKSPVRIEEDADGYTVTTGAAAFRISKRRFSLFEEVRLSDGAVIVARPAPGRPRDGALVTGLKPTVTRAIPGPGNTGRSHLIYVTYAGKAPIEDYTLRFVTDRQYQVAGKKAGPVGTGQYLKDFASTDGAIAIPADAWLRYAFPKRGDAYTFRTIPEGAAAAAEGVFRTTVLERGPLRSVIEVKGSFGPTTAPVLEYSARYHFHAGSGRVRLLFTIENNDFGGRTSTGNARNANIGGVNCVFFDDMSLFLRPAVGRDGHVSFAFGEHGDAEPGGGGNGRPGMTVELYQDSNGGEHWDRYRAPKYGPRPNRYVTFRGWRDVGGEEPTRRGDRLVPVVTAQQKNGGQVLVTVRDFWQNHPKSLAVTNEGALRIGLFPGRYAGDFPLRSGEHKTHTILFDFRADPLGCEAQWFAALAFSNPLRLEPTARWIAGTGALGDLHPYDPEHYKAYEVRNLSAVGIWPEGLRKGLRHSIFTRREQHAFYGWMDYGDVPIDFEAPSGQWGMKYDLDYQMAQQWARTLRPEWWDLFVAADRHTADIDIHHQPHYPGLHYVKGGVWAHSLHDEPGHKNPHRNYNHFTRDLCFGARGTAALYYLTGDWKAREACLEIAENALARYMSPRKDPGDPGKNNRMGVRGDACTLNRLLEGYLLTGAEKYLDRARWQVRACAFDGRPAAHKKTSLWSSVFYMMALARYVEMFPEDRAARTYLLAHIETLRRSVDPDNGIWYRVTPQPDGGVVGSGTCSHYNIMAADALAIGYRFTGDARYIHAARRCFAYGVRNACWKNGPPTYYHIHSANGATHGNVFMTVDSALREKGSEDQDQTLRDRPERL